MSDPPAHRFYLDEGMPSSAAQIARGLGLDVITAGEVGSIPRSDAEHLAAAAAQGRAVVTYNRHDFLKLTADCFAAGKRHAGVLLVVSTVPRLGSVLAHALERWSADRAPLQAYEVQFLSAWPPVD
jgi:hypothetical protein